MSEASMSRKPTIAQVRKRLLAEGLTPLVAEHRAIGRQRLLRFAPGTTVGQRFAVYAVLGLARDAKPLIERKPSQPAKQTKSTPSTHAPTGAA